MVSIIHPPRPFGAARHCKRLLGTTRQEASDYRTASPYLSEALSLFRDLRDRRGAADALACPARVHVRQKRRNIVEKLSLTPDVISTIRRSLPSVGCRHAI